MTLIAGVLALTINLIALSCGTKPAVAAETPTRAQSLSILRDQYGLRFVDAEGARWLPDELASIVSLLPRLPSGLSRIGLSTQFGAIRVFKLVNAGQSTPERTHQAPLSLLRWQMTIDPVDDDIETLQRRFVHHLLHAYDAVHKLSSSDRWRRLSGWSQRTILNVRLPLAKDAANQDLRGYATADGLYSAEADFVTFGELYFVPTVSSSPEESIACRTQEKFAFFRRHLGDPPMSLALAATQCLPSGDGFLDDLLFLDPVTRQPLDLGPVDADHIEGFELLYATPGVQDAAEIAGHLVLRIRLRNNPRAEHLGLENPHDLVVSFLADTGDTPAELTQTQPPLAPVCEDSWLGLALPRGGSDGDGVDAVRSVVQALKGLSGGFLTTFDRQTLQQTIRTYTVDQDRNLLRYRLNLTPAQKAGLIARLYAAKKNYKTKYFFFDRNCASVLVQIIGEGIGVNAVADFDPLVVPPNALVALLVREGLATPVFPSFYGYRKRAYVAQELMRERLQELHERGAANDLPTTTGLLHKQETVRLEAYARLAALASHQPALARDVYQLASLAQEAEMAFVDKSAACELYATRGAEALRLLQGRLVADDPNLLEAASLDVNQEIYRRFSAQDSRDSGAGSPHTHLSSIFVGGGLAHGTHTQSALFLGATLHRQDLGSLSSLSMQRATSVALGDVEATLLPGEAGTGTLGPWRATGLKLRKLKERLDTVPSYLTRDGGLGLGLTLLDWQGDPERGTTQSRLVGGELIANLASSRLYDDYLIASLGTDLTATWKRDAPEAGYDTAWGAVAPAFPLYLEGLLTLGDSRRWQLRGRSEVRYTIVSGTFHRAVTADASLVRRLAWRQDTELLLRTSGTVRFDPAISPDRRLLMQLGLEWNRW